jgi:hypothetical protein
MEKTVFYKKQGRQYVAIGEYDPEFQQRMPYGSHLIVARKGCQTTKYNVEPAFVPAIAAGIYALDAITSKIYQAGELRSVNPLTEQQQKAYKKFYDTLDPVSSHHLTYGSAREAADAGVNELINQIQHLLQNPAVKTAYEHFMLMCKLATENQQQG